MSKRAESIIQKEKYCYLCQLFEGKYNYQNLECHHIFNGPNRPISDRLGLWVWLCNEHHTGSNESVHLDPDGIGRGLKRIGQKHFEIQLGSREEFMSLIGKNYL